MKAKIKITALLQKPAEMWEWEFPNPITYNTPEELNSYLLGKHARIYVEGGILFSPVEGEMRMIHNERILDVTIRATQIPMTQLEIDQEATELVLFHHPEARKVH